MRIDADLETGWIQTFEADLAGFYRLRAGRPRKQGKVWMFDNEIDWVMRIWSVSSYQLPRGVLKGCKRQMTQYKAEHMQ